MAKKDQPTEHHVVIKLNHNELAMITNILDRFLDQGREVYKSCGVKTKKQEIELNKLHSRLDTIFWENFDEHTVLKKMWGMSLTKAGSNEQQANSN